jgi:hypothetical protein
LRLVEPASSYSFQITKRALAALRDLKNSGKKVPAGLIEPHRALAYLLTHPNACVINKRFFVVWQEGQPWFSGESILQEVMVLRIGPGGSLGEVVEFLHDTAKHLGCSAVMAGTFFSINDELCSALYRRAGGECVAHALAWRV